MENLNKIDKEVGNTKVNDLADRELLATLSVFGMDEFKNRFKSYFFANGFKDEKALPLIPNLHKSVLFTNSTVVSILEKIRQDNYDSSYVIEQPCLRTQNMSEDLKTYPKYMSAFTMLGAISKFADYDKISHLLIHFFNNFFNKDDIKLAIDHSHDQHINFWKGKGYDFMQHPNNYYNRTFGSKQLNGKDDTIMKEVSGKGLSFMLKSNGQYIEIGNLIIINIGENSEFVSFGIGLETLMHLVSHQKMHQVEFSHAPQKVFDLIDYQSSESLHVRLIDTYNILKTLYSNGLRISSSGRSGVIRKGWTIFLNIASTLGLDYEKQKDIISTMNEVDALLDFNKRYKHE